MRFISTTACTQIISHSIFSISDYSVQLLLYRALHKSPGIDKISLIAKNFLKKKRAISLLNLCRDNAQK